MAKATITKTKAATKRVTTKSMLVKKPAKKKAAPEPEAAPQQAQTAQEPQGKADNSFAALYLRKTKFPAIAMPITEDPHGKKGHFTNVLVPGIKVKSTATGRSIETTVGENEDGSPKKRMVKEKLNRHVEGLVPVVVRVTSGDERNGKGFIHLIPEVHEGMVKKPIEHGLPIRFAGGTKHSHAKFAEAC